MRRIAILSTCLIVLGFTATNAKGGKTNEAKTTEAVASPAETKAKTGDATAWFIYNGPQPGTSTQLNTASNYGTTQVEPDELCPTPGVNRCAAEFNVDGSGHRMGTPSGDIATKSAN